MVSVSIIARVSMRPAPPTIVVEALEQLGGRDLGEEAEAAEVHAEQRHRVRDDGPRGAQDGAVAAAADEQVGACDVLSRAPSSQADATHTRGHEGRQPLARLLGDGARRFGLRVVGDADLLHAAVLRSTMRYRAVERLSAVPPIDSRTVSRAVVVGSAEEELTVAGGAEQRRSGDAADAEAVVDAPPCDAADDGRMDERIADDAAALDLVRSASNCGLTSATMSAPGAQERR